MVYKIFTSGSPQVFETCYMIGPEALNICTMTYVYWFIAEHIDTSWDTAEAK